MSCHINFIFMIHSEFIQRLKDTRVSKVTAFPNTSFEVLLKNQNQSIQSVFLVFSFYFPKFIWVSQVRIFCSMFSSMFFEFFCLCNFTFNFVRGMAEKCWLQLLSFCCDSASANKKMVQKVASLAPPNVLVKLACACAMISSVSCFWLGTFTMAQKTKK